jgi:hypothetical protein
MVKETGAGDRPGVSVRGLLFERLQIVLLMADCSSSTWGKKVS